MTDSAQDIYVLGVYSGHTSTATLLKNGKIIASASEERFNGKKNYLGLPHKSIEWCLKYAGIKASDLAYVALPSLYSAPIHTSSKTKKSSSIATLRLAYHLIGAWRALWGRIVYYIPSLQRAGTMTYEFIQKTIGRYTLEKEIDTIAARLRIDKSKILTFDHHLSHAATAYYSSNFNTDKTLVLTLDAEGDLHCATVSIFDGVNIKRLSTTTREHSLGWLYLYVTQFLGMKPMEHEYKVMGLAPYAKEKYAKEVYKKMKSIITLNPENKLEFKASFNMQDALYYLNKEMRGYRFDNIAAGAQMLLEKLIVQWVQECMRETKIKNIALAGGVFMNIKVNQKISELKQVDNVFFMPSAGDESLSIGACYLGYLKVMDERGTPPKCESITDLYLGPSYSNKEVKAILSSPTYKNKYKITKIEKIEKKIAELLSARKVVARCAGRMEWGARALGNRSIIAHPAHTDVVMLINEQMKNRDFWMPFAPSILREKASNYIENPRKLDSPYMSVGFHSKPRSMKEMRAPMHPYDHTIRPQLVQKSWNPSYYEIIHEFERLTGIGGVLNTSFNLHGYPIVMGPHEALYAFENSGLEYLALENYLIEKKS